MEVPPLLHTFLSFAQEVSLKPLLVVNGDENSSDDADDEDDNSPDDNDDDDNSPDDDDDDDSGSNLFSEVRHLRRFFHSLHQGQPVKTTTVRCNEVFLSVQGSFLQ